MIRCPESSAFGLIRQRIGFADSPRFRAAARASIRIGIGPGIGGASGSDWRPQNGPT
jgi:hypothetical protein